MSSSSAAAYQPFELADSGRQRDEIELIASENIVSRAVWRRRAR
jgi:glycine/serine hydroxymethyltransferase